MNARFKKLFRRKNGQSLVEFALILPLLLMLILGMVETGYAFYDYMLVVSSNREAVRLGSRGRYDDPSIVQRLISTGGISNGESTNGDPNLRTWGSDPNLGVIIHHITLDQDNGSIISQTVYISGTIAVEGAQRAIEITDSRITDQDWQEYITENGKYNTLINDYREANGYDSAIDENLIVIETFMAHRSLTGILSFFQDPISLYFSSTMRVMQDSRIK